MKLAVVISWTVLSSAAVALKAPPGAESVPIPLDAYFNNKGFGSKPGEASLDVLGQSYPADIVGDKGIYTSAHSGIQYLFPGYRPGASSDNVICESQEITVPKDRYFSVSVLASSDLRSTIITGNMSLQYTDGTSTTAEIRVHAFWWFLAVRRGEITFPYFFTHNDTNHNASEIYESTAVLDSTKTLESIVLPDVANATTGRLHVFALSLFKGPDVHVQSLRPTQKWDTEGNQLVELIVNNAGTKCVSGMTASITAPGVESIGETVIKRLCPNDQKIVNVAVKGSHNGTVTAVLKLGNETPWGKKLPVPVKETPFNDISIGLRDYTPDRTSLVQHEIPQWYDDSKFGIFIHWGPYSVPGWGNSTPTECYAEWFWWYSTRIGAAKVADRCDFNEYRLRTYGPDLNYDDFFENYTASKWDPKEWVDLFADAGAQYFVFTTKHHDGFANFDSGSATNRTALHYGPKRDLLGELFEAAKTYQPHLRRGTYFSLPEWFNPDFGKYGFTQFATLTSTSQPGIIARNPYTGLDEPYTGRLPIGDFIEDLMVPQMEALAYKYDTEIIWCDAGAANDTARFAAKWFNWARSQGRQVTINDRCGSPWTADFDTPEYTTFNTAQRRKWESNSGMDPYSYGYNRATAESSYKNATSVVHDLVDIVSKNGNLLLDIGPRADGTIDQREVDNLREAGTWLKAHAEAVFNTTYWAVTPEEGNLRFTQTNDAFYVLSLEEPSLGRLVIHSKIPALLGDRVSVLGMGGESRVNWGPTEKGGIWIDVTEEIVNGDKFCWVFKIEYAS